MFGYVRPYKPDLRIKDFTWYRAVYCGLCKSLKRGYGELPRLATTYDLTFMAVLLLAFHGEAPVMEADRCVLMPLRKHGIAEAHPVLDFTAATAVLLALEKMQDNIDDGDQAILNRVFAFGYRRPAKKAKQNYPQLADVISRGMEACKRLEEEAISGNMDKGALLPRAFGEMLRDIFELAPGMTAVDPITREALLLSAVDLGEWIYLIDAQDDFEADREEGRYNALLYLPPQEIDPDHRQAYIDSLHTEEKMLTERDHFAMQAAARLYLLEQRIDRQLALLTYPRFGELIANVACDGLFDIRMTVMSGGVPTKL